MIFIKYKVQLAEWLHLLNIKVVLIQTKGLKIIIIKEVNIFSKIYQELIK